MENNDNLKRTIEYALNGVPEIKSHEKRIWLGEFRERVIAAISIEDAKKELAIGVLKQKLEDKDVEMIIVNNYIPIEIMSKYMKLAKEYNIEYKTVNTDFSEAMGVVVASRKAVNRKEVMLEVKKLPEKFKELDHKDICNKCHHELKQMAPEYIKEFKRINLIDRVMGLKCGVCERHQDGGPLM